MIDPPPAPHPAEAGAATAPQAPAPRPADGEPAFWPRVVSPVIVLAASIVVAVIVGGVASASGASQDAAGSLAVAAASLGILVFGLLVVRSMRPLDRRLVFVRKGSLVSAVGIGIAGGIAALIAAGIVLTVGAAIDPGAGDKLDQVGRDLQESAGVARWQEAVLVMSLVLLAPLGEELVFRGVLLRTLVRRVSFPAAAVLSSCVFALAHLDQYDPYPIWPRTLSLAVIGVILCALYRARGYLGSVTAHATVNAVAAVAIFTQ